MSSFYIRVEPVGLAATVPTVRGRQTQLLCSVCFHCYIIFQAGTVPHSSTRLPTDQQASWFCLLQTQLQEHLAHAPCTHVPGFLPGRQRGAGLLGCGMRTSFTPLGIAKLLSKVVVQTIALKYKLNHVASLLKTLKWLPITPRIKSILPSTKAWPHPTLCPLSPIFWPPVSSSNRSGFHTPEPLHILMLLPLPGTLFFQLFANWLLLILQVSVKMSPPRRGLP